jgi:hypothetical protein
MIEIDGTAYPLEPGKTYLIVVDINRISRQLIDMLPSLLKERFNIHAAVIGVKGNPAACVRVIGPVAPEEGK